MKTTKSECPVPTGALLVIGGRENKGGGPESRLQEENFTHEEVLKTFLKLTEKKSPKLMVITSGSEGGEKAFAIYKKVFSQLKIKDIRAVHHNNRDDCLGDPVIDEIDQVDAVFIAGGDQLKLSSTYGGTRFLSRLKERYIYENLIVAGSSAGAMAMSTPMIYAGEASEQAVDGTIRITTGLEFMRDVCVDTDFIDRGRLVRMAQVIATNPGCVGLGIQEDTAVVVRKGVQLSVCGSGVVIILDGRTLSRTNITQFTQKVPLSVRDLNIQVLSREDSFELPVYNPPHI